MTITVENHWGISTDIDRHIRIVDQAAGLLSPSLRPRFGCCFDPANTAPSPKKVTWWRELTQRANHYHLKTTTFDSTDLPHSFLFKLLQESGYRGDVTIEFAGSGSPTAGIKQSARLFYQPGALFQI